MKFLVTGGAGFIGSAVVRHLINNLRHEVVHIDKLTYAGNLNNLTDISHNPNYSFCKGDICSRELVNNLFIEYEFDTVINFAAESHVDRSIMDSSPFLKSNILGTSNILEHSMLHGIDKFIQISTDEVYGSIKKGHFTEQSSLKPNSPYASSKASADMICRAFHATYDLPIIITRCTNNYGPYQFPEKLIPLIINNATKGVSIPLYGDGKNVRDWIYVDDHCSAIWTILKNGRIGQTYLVGADAERTNLQTICSICSLMDKMMSESVKFIEDRAGHDLRYAIDGSKLRDELGWKPNYTFLGGMSETITYYKKKYNLLL